MFLIVVLILFILPQTNGFADVTEVELTLSGAIQRSLATHPEILASQKSLQQAAGLLRQADVHPNPELQLNFGTSSILGDSGDQEWSIAYVHTLELGNKRKKRLTVAELGVLIAKQQLEERKRQLILEIKKDFADTLTNQALLQTTTRFVELHKKLHDLTTARVDEGEAAAVEKDLSQIELDRLEIESVKNFAEFTSAISKLRLSARLSESESIKGSFAENLSTEKLELAALLKVAKENNPQLQIAVLENQQAEATVSLSKAEAISNLNVFLEYSNEKSQFDAFGINANGIPIPLKDSDQILSTGVSFNLPFSRNQGNIAAAVAQSDQAKLRTAFIERTIQEEVTNAFRKYEVSRQAFKLYSESIVNRSEKQIEVMRVSFEAGELRFLDWMNEQRRALEIQKEFVLAAKDLFLAVSELEFVTGSALKSEEGL